MDSDIVRAMAMAIERVIARYVAAATHSAAFCGINGKTMARAVPKSWLIKAVVVSASCDPLHLWIVDVVIHMRRPSRSRETGVAEVPTLDLLSLVAAKVLRGCTCQQIASLTPNQRIVLRKTDLLVETSCTLTVSCAAAARSKSHRPV